MPTLNSAAPPGCTTPSAPQYAPRGDDFQRRNRLHRRYFGRAGDGPAWEKRGENRCEVHARHCLADDGRCHLPHGGEGLDGEKLRNTNAALACDAGNVVAQEIDDHKIFGAVLRRRAQTGGGLARRSRALHGPGHNLSRGRVPCKEQLRRDGSNLPLSEIQKERVSAGLRLAKRIEKRARLPLELGAKAGGQIDLVIGAGGDAFADVFNLFSEDGGSHVALPVRATKHRFRCVFVGLGWGIEDCESGERNAFQRRQRLEGVVKDGRGFVGHHAHGPSAFASVALNLLQDRKNIARPPRRQNSNRTPEIFPQTRGVITRKVDRAMDRQGRPRDGRGWPKPPPGS